MTVLHGDCREVMRTLDAESVDAIVCDPPYGLSFMGKEWDHGVPSAEFWREAYRVAKPGAHLLAFGGTRTYHRLACAIEDAGWEVRDCLSWLYGSGFPKSHDVSKHIDRSLGAVRSKDKPISSSQGMNAMLVRHGGQNKHWIADAQANGQRTVFVANDIPVTDLARQWQGWGTALKPAWEPIIVARKPLQGTVASNVAQYGTGAINVDGTRIGGESGRWPANVVMDEDAAAMLDAQTGELAGGNRPAVRNTSGVFTAHAQGETGNAQRMDSGGASRFFYTAKASRREREAGLEGMPKRQPVHGKGHETGGLQVSNSINPAANHHPTVKPIALMRWLCRLVTPPNGLVLDPFTGSGSTGCAAVLEGFRFVGIEREAEYVAIATKRIAYWASQREEPEPSLFG